MAHYGQHPVCSICDAMSQQLSRFNQERRHDRSVKSAAARDVARNLGFDQPVVDRIASFAADIPIHEAISTAIERDVTLSNARFGLKAIDEQLKPNRVQAAIRWLHAYGAYTGLTCDQERDLDRAVEILANL